MTDLSSNRLSVSASRDSILKHYLPKRHGFGGLKYGLLKALGRQVPVEFWSPRERRDFEMECLQLWESKGFRVPAVLGHGDADGPELKMEFLDGPTLNQYLRDDDVSMEDKLESIAAVFSEMRERHCLGIYEGDRHLVHFDSNTRNIILCSDGPARIDFEMGRFSEKVDRSFAREVKKLSLEIANHLGRENLETVADSLLRDYGIRHILRRMADEELDRSLAFLHKSRDESRKHKRPGLVTKLDVAHVLRQKVGAARQERKATSSTSKARSSLELAERGSWDGKFYQSLDDSDKRGRDMVHRRQVMRLPESFEGKSILDIGCNLGRFCIDAAQAGAVRSVGIDFREDVMEAIASYCSEHSIPAQFHAFDIEDGVAKLHDLLGSERFDYVCALSIWSHVDQAKLWEIVEATCGEVFYLEDNAPSRVKSLEKVEAILRENLRFATIDFLGFTTDRGVRALFRLSR